MKNAVEQKLFVIGPAGKIETVITFPIHKPSGIAIIAHPHPLYQGNMDNKVVYITNKALIEKGFITAKFNFRGVGASEGKYAEGVGEISDVLAVTRFMQENYGATLNHALLVLAGFSFGGAIQAFAAQQLNPHKLILIAPSVARMNTPQVVAHAGATLIIHGDHDDIVPLQSVIDWANPQGIAVTVIPDAAHFFHGKLTILKQAIMNFC